MSPATGVTIGVVSRPEVALKAVQVPQEGERHPDDRLVGCPEKVLARPVRLRQRIRPRSTQLQQLRAVHETLAPVGDEIRLRRAPLRQRLGPLVGPTQVEDLVTGTDHSAVQQADDHRRDVARHRRHHDLIEQGEALGRAAQSQQRLSATQPPQRTYVGVVEPVADLGGPAEDVACRRRVAGEQVLQGDRHEQQAFLGALGARVRDQPLAAGEASHWPAPSRPC